MTTADDIHEHIANQAALADISGQMAGAIHAIVDLCQRMRTAPIDQASNGVSSWAADELEKAIARALGINND